MYYQRILASQDKAAVSKEIQTTEPKPEYEKIIKDPYVMEFLQIQPDTHVYEGELEQALIDLTTFSIFFWNWDEDFLLYHGKSGLRWMDRIFSST